MRFRSLAAPVLALCPFVVLGQTALPKSAKDLHQYDLQKVKWEVRFDPAKGAIRGDVVNTLKVTDNGATIVFDCVDLNVLGVKVDGKPVKFVADRKVIMLQPETPFRGGQTLDVAISYEGDPEAGVYFVPAKRAYPAKGDIVYTQGEMVDNRYWLPTYDWPNDKATSEGLIHVPKGWKALSNGKLVEVTKGATDDVWHWRIDQPHSTYLISFTAGDYTEMPDGKGDTTVSNWIPAGLEDWGQAAFGGTSAIVDFYGKLTGFKYPWPKYSQSAVPDFMFGGMENVSCTTQTIGALFPPSAKSTNDSSGLVAHELAHQWFGDTVTTPTWAHVWINEGWATFLPSFWVRESEGETAYDLSRLGTFEGGLSGHRGAPNRGMIFDGYEEPIDVFDSFAYPGGASRMFMLMHELGEPVFWSAVKEYLRDYKFQNVDTEIFFRSFEKSTHRDLDAFRKQWFYTSAAPNLTARRVDGKVAVVQAGHNFTMPLEIGVLDSSGKWEMRTVNLSAEQTPLDVPKGSLVLLDPKVWIMGDVSYDLGYTAEDWLRLYRLAPNAAQKSRLLSSVLNSATIEDKIKLAREEHVVPLKRTLLANLKDERLMLDMSQNSDDRVVQTALAVMGDLPSSAAVLDRLNQVIASSSNDSLKSVAYQSLLDLKGDDALATKMYATASYDELIRLHALNWWVQHDPNKARQVCLDAIANPPSEPVRLAAIRHLGGLRDKPGERVVYNVLAAMLTERSNSPLRTAIGAIAQYGDKAAIPLLEKRKNHGLHFVRRDIQSALRRLQK